MRPNNKKFDNDLSEKYYKLLERTIGCKNMTWKVDFEKLAEEFNVTVDRMTEAGTKVVEAIESIKEFAEKDDGWKDDFFRKSIRGQLYQKRLSGLAYAKENGTEFKGVVLSIGESEDANRFERTKCYKEFTNDAVNAIKKRYMARVKVAVEKPEELKELTSEEVAYVKSTGTMWRFFSEIDEEWKDTRHKLTWNEEPINVPLFHEPTKKGSDVPNPLYGMPVQMKMEKKMFFWMDDALWIAKGDMGIMHKVTDKDGNVKYVGTMPEIGATCSFWGRKYAGIKNQAHVGNITVIKEGYEAGEKVSDKDLWTLAEKLSEIQYKGKNKDTKEEFDASLYVELSDVNDLPNYGFFVTHGTVGSADVNTYNGKNGEFKKITVNVFDDSTPRGINLSTFYEPMANLVNVINEGDEVVVIGERGSYKSDETDDNGKPIWKPMNILAGIYKNPTDNTSADIARLHELLNGKKE